MSDMNDRKHELRGELRDKLEDAFDLMKYVTNLNDGTGAHYVDLVVYDLIKNAYTIVKRQVEEDET